ncbi:MAG: hypothetical protein KGQ46_06095 [Hyphomicrobiales bacterium]|nr:hypothetical protein [Hyphomicrobiales bacterium]MDE2114739.1 hypothetical protein [Hyphomicrobiales bacterium]
MRISIDRVPEMFSLGTQDAEASDPDLLMNAPMPSAPAQAVKHPSRLMSGWQVAKESTVRMTQALSFRLQSARVASVNRSGCQSGFLDMAPSAGVSRRGWAGAVKKLDCQTLVKAYARGLHPRGSWRRVDFCAPENRLVCHPANLFYTQELRALWQRNAYQISFDRKFDELVTKCSTNSGWSGQHNAKIKRAHARLFGTGVAHSFEISNAKGALIGGGYGMATGDVFVLEGLFCRDISAAQFGLTVFARHLANWGFGLIDATFVAPMLNGMGFYNLSREPYNKRLTAHEPIERISPWCVDPAIYQAQRRSETFRGLFANGGFRQDVKNAISDETREELWASLGLRPNLAATAAEKAETQGVRPSLRDDLAA